MTCGTIFDAALITGAVTVADRTIGDGDGLLCGDIGCGEFIGDAEFNR